MAKRMVRGKRVKPRAASRYTKAKGSGPGSWGPAWQKKAVSMLVRGDYMGTRAATSLVRKYATGSMSWTALKDYFSDDPEVWMWFLKNDPTKKHPSSKAPAKAKAKTPAKPSAKAIPVKMAVRTGDDDEVVAKAVPASCSAYVKKQIRASQARAKAYKIGAKSERFMLLFCHPKGKPKPSDVDGDYFGIGFALLIVRNGDDFLVVDLDSSRPKVIAKEECAYDAVQAAQEDAYKTGT